MSKKNLSLYIHIPFCVSKCSYCNFCSFPATLDTQKKYLRALNQEIVACGKKYQDRVINTIYIGGGTPSTLNDGAIADILKNVRENFCTSKNVDITIEANPNSFTRKKAEEYSQAGCNRLSLGLQAINPNHLKILNRCHNFKQCKDSINYAINSGITDINLDILIGIPTQNIWDVKEMLDKITALPITHISAYSLINEDNTPLTRQIVSKMLPEPNSLDVVNFYDFTVDYLQEKGFFRYEISNFAKKGYQSRHNLNYWARGEYLGVGLGAYSFCDGVHWENTSNLADYILAPTESQCGIEPENIITAKEEFIMLALRTTQGLDIAKYNKLFSADFIAEHRKNIDYLSNILDLIEIKDGFVRAKNFYMTNTIISRLFEFE